MLVLQYLLKHPEIDTSTAASLCQRNENDMRNHLSAMEQRELIEHGGKGRGGYWCIRPELYQRLADDDHAEQRRRIDWEAAKTRVFSILMERSKRNESGLSNKDIRQITRFDRNQVYRLMKELRAENPELSPPGKGKQACYSFRQ